LPARTNACFFKQGCKDSNPVRECWNLAALPGAHPCVVADLSASCGSPPGAYEIARAGSSSRNLAQLAIRSPCAA
jgi:hypothetical protein